MAELTSKKRSTLPKKEFGLPNQEKYPMPDKEHAINAKARAKQMLDKGKLNYVEYSKIVRKANAVIKGGK